MKLSDVTYVTFRLNFTLETTLPSESLYVITLITIPASNKAHGLEVVSLFHRSHVTALVFSQKLSFFVN